VILAIEAATDVASVAIVDARGVRVEHVCDRRRDALRWLVIGIDSALRDAAIPAAQIDAVAVSAGPGSFTGLRVGIATAAGWARAGGASVRAVPTLEALAWRAPRVGITVPILDARRGEVAFAAFVWVDGAARRLIAETTCPPAEAADCLAEAVADGEEAMLLGDGLRAYRAVFDASLPRARILPDSMWTPRAAHVGRLGERLLRTEGPTPAPALLPGYGRVPRFRARANGEESAATPTKR